MKSTSPSFRVNDEIKNCATVRLIGENFESKVVPFDEAKKIANSMEVDLVEINDKAVPHIVKLCVFEKFLYELKKQAKKNKPNVTTKEVQLSVNIAKHDLETKANQARDFLARGHKIKVVLTMRGRELSRRDENKRVIVDFTNLLDDISLIESMRDDNNKTIVILKRKK